MNYKNHYDLLIEKSRNRVLPIGVYTERHHIIPRCMNGNNDKSNIAILFPEEHYLAHLLLVKIFPKNHKLVYAAQALATIKRGGKVNNKFYGWLQRKNSSIRTITHKGRIISEKTRQKMREARLGKTHSPDSIAKMKGRKHSNSRVENMRSANRSDELFSIPIVQYDMDGNFIAIWKNAQEAKKVLSTGKINITEAIKNKWKAGDFYWRLLEENYPTKIIVKDSRWSFYIKKDCHGNVIGEWRGLKLASKENLISVSGIKSSIKDKKIVNGFYWEKKYI